jgi:hypothetical protein
MLCQAGIPAWWVRSEDTITEHTNIIGQVNIEPLDPDINLAPFKNEKGESAPFPVFYKGGPGEDRNAAIRWRVFRELDPKPPPAVPVPDVTQSASVTVSDDSLRQAVENIVGVTSPESLRQVVKDVVLEHGSQLGPIRSTPSPSPRSEPYRMFNSSLVYSY